MSDLELPEGVFSSPDGRLWLLPEADAADGWERRIMNSDDWTGVGKIGPWRTVVEVRLTPAPATEDVPVWEAIRDERTATTAPSGRLMKLSGFDTLIFRDHQGDFRLMFDDAGHAEEHRPHVNPDGTVTVLVER